MFRSNVRSFAYCVAFAGLASCIDAAVHRVPGDWPDIDLAITYASSGDEIRVANTHTDSLGFSIVSGKDLKIVSYAPDFSAPSPGAKWESFDPDKNVNNAILSISNAKISIEGFSSIVATDFNAFYLGEGADLTIKDSTISGVTLSDTAAVKIPSGTSNVKLNIVNSTIKDGGRAIWPAGLKGTSLINIENSNILNHSSYPIEYRTQDGVHTFNIINSVLESNGIAAGTRPYRIFLFGAPADSLTQNTVNIDSSLFRTGSNGGMSIAWGGINRNGTSNNHAEGSFARLNVTNSVFDLRQSKDTNSHAAITHQDDDYTAAYKRLSEINIKHCTVLVGGTAMPGFRSLETNSVMNIYNTIIDGNGGGGYALRGWRGTINSFNNLLNTENTHQTAGGGSVVLSGDEIIASSAGERVGFVKFIDRDNGNFKLNEGSPALDAGTVAAGVSVDKDGNIRPLPSGSNPDIGAYEVSGLASVNNWTLY